MPKLDTENVARLAIILSRYSKNNDARCAANAVLLAKIGAQLHTLAEHDCNHGLTDRQQTRRDNLMNKARDLLAFGEYAGVKVSESRDPRGYCLRLQFPGGESNNMGGDFGV